MGVNIQEIINILENFIETTNVEFPAIRKAINKLKELHLAHEFDLNMLRDEFEHKQDTCEHDWIPARWVMVCKKCQLSSEITLKAIDK